MTTPDVPLNDGQQMPQLGYGVFRIDDDAAAAAVGAALAAGYRSVDTASLYGNEAGVGRGIRDSGVPRQQVFVTTKVWNPDQGYDRTRRAFDASLARLGLETVDLYLIHWPWPQRGLTVETWKALIALRDEGRATSIGVSNFRREDLHGIIDATGVTPAVNQIELHPHFQQRLLRDVHTTLGIATEAWSPLGRGAVLADPTIAGIAANHRRSPAQVILAWHMAMDIIAIPKSGNPARIAENFSVFDFRLDDAEMAAISGLDRQDGRIGPDPAVYPG